VGKVQPKFQLKQVYGERDPLGERRNSPHKNCNKLVGSSVRPTPTNHDETETSKPGQSKERNLQRKAKRIEKEVRQTTHSNSYTRLKDSSNFFFSLMKIVTKAQKSTTAWTQPRPDKRKTNSKSLPCSHPYKEVPLSKPSLSQHKQPCKAAHTH